MNRSMSVNFIVGLMLVSLLLTSCAPQPTPILPTPTFAFISMVEPTEASKDGMPEYARPGPFTVAMIQISIMNGSYDIKTYILYPSDLDGYPETSKAPYPLVILSPGLSGSGGDYLNLLNHLASYGFVAVSWVPRTEIGDNTWAAASYRPLDMKSIMDELEKMASPGGELAGLVDVNRTIVMGHSWGGGTALMSAGATTSFTWCSAHADLIPEDQEMLCREFINHQDDIANVLGLDGIPSGEWPSMADPRVIAIIPMAAVGKYWGADFEGVANIKVPALIMTGSNDVVVKPELAAFTIYDHLGSQKKTLVVFNGEDHEYFILKNYANGTPLYHIATAFLLAEVKGDKEAAKALSSINTSFKDIDIKSTEFNSQ